MNGNIDLFRILRETDNILANTVKYRASFCRPERILIKLCLFNGNPCLVRKRLKNASVLFCKEIGELTFQIDQSEYLLSCHHRYPDPTTNRYVLLIFARVFVRRKIRQDERAKMILPHIFPVIPPI